MSGEQRQEFLQSFSQSVCGHLTSTPAACLHSDTLLHQSGFIATHFKQTVQSECASLSSTDKLDVDPRSHRASAASKPPLLLLTSPPLPPFLCLFLLFSRAFTDLTFRSLQEWLPGSLPGISQLLSSPRLRTPCLVRYSQQRASCLSSAAQLLLLPLSVYS